MQEGVGTNRFAYSFNDPVNGKDPSGHCIWDACIGETIGLAVGIAGLIAGAEVVSDVTVDGELNGNGALMQTGQATADLIAKTTAGIGHNNPPSDVDLPSTGSDIVDEALDRLGGRIPGKQNPRSTPQFEAKGADLPSVVKELESLGIEMNKVKGKKGDVYVGELPNGDKVVVRPNSGEGRPTVEIQDKKTKRPKSETRLGEKPEDPQGKEEPERKGGNDSKKVTP